MGQKQLIASFTAGLALFLMSGPATAGPLEDGLAAWNKSDYSRAIALLRPLADQGSAPAQRIMGEVYLQGLGAAEDKPRAAAYFDLAANQGDNDARLALGNMLIWGNGVPANPEKAADLYEQALPTGDAFAQFNFGWTLVNGRGRPRNLEAGYRYYRLAAAQGMQLATDSLPNNALADGDRLTPADLEVTVSEAGGLPLYTLKSRRTIQDIVIADPKRPGAFLIIDFDKPFRIYNQTIEVYLKWDERSRAASGINFSLMTVEMDCDRHRFRETLVYDMYKTGGGGVGSPDHPDWFSPAKGTAFDQVTTRVCQMMAYLKPDLASMAGAPPPQPDATAQTLDLDNTSRR